MIAPVPVMSAPVGSPPLTSAAVAALPSGDVLVIGQAGIELRYAARVGDVWTPARRLPSLRWSGSAVSAMRRGDRWLVSWLGRGGAPGSRTLVFADFHGARRAPRIGRLFTRWHAFDPVAVPGLAAGARAAWPVADGMLMEGATDTAGDWRSAGLIPGNHPLSPFAMTSGPGARRLLVAATTDEDGAVTGWAVAGPGQRLPALRPLYRPPAGRAVIAAAPLFRASGPPAAVLLTRADPLRLRIEAVSIAGGVARAPVVVTSRRAAIEPPRVVSLADGRLLAVWRRITPAGAVQVVAANERVAGGAWTAPVVVSGRRRAGPPSLAVTGSGRPVVAWGDGRRVLARALRAGSRVVPGTTVSLSGALRGCGRPAVATAGARTLVAAFPCGPGRRLYANPVRMPAR